jgi:hypothetical protein
MAGHKSVKRVQADVPAIRAFPGLVKEGIWIPGKPPGTTKLK